MKKGSKQAVINQLVDTIRGITYQRDSGVVGHILKGLVKMPFHAINNLLFLIDLNMVSKDKETLVYIVDIQNNTQTSVSDLSSDEDFIKEAEKQENNINWSNGGVVTLERFQEGLNNDDININNCFIRFIEVSK